MGSKQKLNPTDAYTRYLRFQMLLMTVFKVTTIVYVALFE